MEKIKNRFPRSSSWGKSATWYSKIVGEQGHYYHKHVILPEVLKALSLKPHLKLIDLGCGQGVLARSLPSDIEYLGVDISGALVNEAKQLDTNRLHSFMIADASKTLKLEANYFDYAVMILSLQNIKDSQAVFNTISKVLKTKGTLLLVLNHPCFRIPRQSGWTIDQGDKSQKRWINRYMSSMDIPVSTHPSNRSSAVTWSFHKPLSLYVKEIVSAGMSISGMEEITSDKESEGKMRKAENRSRAEIPLFMLLKAVKL